MKHGSLFSGIGGFDLAAEWMGWKNVFHCEWMEFPRKVLDYYWPDADSHIDICKTDFTKYANTIDILTGGFPCQPFSLAGKRKGTDDERYLWHEMLRAIREIKPKWVIAENVFGIVNIDGGMVFEQVCVDLENQGYEVQPFIIPAAAKDAPHRRDRCWFIAYSKCNANGLRSKRWMGVAGNLLERCQWKEKANGFDNNGKNGNATDTDNNGQHERNSNDEINASEGRFNAQHDIEQTFMHTNSAGCKGQYFEQNGKGQFDRPDCGNGINNFQNFPSQSPVCSGDDGLPTQLDGITFSKWRNESIKGYGNAIVPQIAYQLFQIIEHESKNQNT